MGVSRTNVAVSGAAVYCACVLPEFARSWRDYANGLEANGPRRGNCFENACTQIRACKDNQSYRKRSSTKLRLITLGNPPSDRIREAERNERRNEEQYGAVIATPRGAGSAKRKVRTVVAFLLSA